ncbi:MAG: hypothetical protein AAF196_12555 [Planctomycetota bacterium]
MLLKPVQLLEPEKPSVSRRSLLSAFAGLCGGVAVGLGSRAFVSARPEDAETSPLPDWHQEALALADGPARELVLQHEFFLIAAARIGFDDPVVRFGLARLSLLVVEPRPDVPEAVRERARRSLDQFLGIDRRFALEGGR